MLKHYPPARRHLPKLAPRALFVPTLTVNELTLLFINALMRVFMHGHWRGLACANIRFDNHAQCRNTALTIYIFSLCFIVLRYNFRAYSI